MGVSSLQPLLNELKQFGGKDVNILLCIQDEEDSVEPYTLTSDGKKVNTENLLIRAAKGNISIKHLVWLKGLHYLMVLLWVSLFIFSFIFSCQSCAFCVNGG